MKREDPKATPESVQDEDPGLLRKKWYLTRAKDVRQVFIYCVEVFLCFFPFSPIFSLSGFLWCCQFEIFSENVTIKLSSWPL